MPRPFLTAGWNNLFLANFAVPADLLRRRLPPGLELDLREGQAFVSLVAFQFLNTRVLGVSWPGYRDFAELNLRYYVRRRGERGVVFVRELAPHRLTAWLARLLYNEPYRAAPMTGTVTRAAEQVRAIYELQWAGRTHTLEATGGTLAYLPEADSVEHFFKEHTWGFGVNRWGRTIRYRVEHPTWEVYPVRDWKIDLDWGLVYGPEWQLLNEARPRSTVFAVGSEVSVYSAASLSSGINTSSGSARQ